MQQDILDWEEELPQPEEEQPERRRAVKFLFYCIGILAVLLYQSKRYFAHIANASGDVMSSFQGFQQMMLIGVAAVWLFSGLGLLSSWRAYRKSATANSIFALAVAHGVFFLSALVTIVRYMS